uniref:uncharacterized protein LOC120824013 n=1 Tax=Gasterosteus aculeatus aculeatus TaxID=481459 RepID=UPI001A9913B9|nr:uncharacterized protein LOC120824013 [Gasterosteus aculeatus aculeatus]XP_040040487.1 uncharacterized protein LOC120824013 [Gasterosteus aculeatus aculeatus]
MFSDSRAPAPGEQRGFKPHAPNFIPWLRSSLKPHHGGDMGLNGPYKSSSEARNNLSPLERAKGIGFFSMQGKERAKKGEVRCKSVGMARMLPVVLRGHHILPGSHQREDRPAFWTQPPKTDPLANAQSTAAEDGQQGASDTSASAQDNHALVGNQSCHLGVLESQNDGTGTVVRKYGPLVRPPPVPVPALLIEEPNRKAPVAVHTEDVRGKVLDYASRTTYRRRDLHSSSWVSSDTQGMERQRGFTSGFRNSQSQRDLREPYVEPFNRPLNGVLFSTEVPLRGLSCTTTLRGPRKPRASFERTTGAQGQNQARVQYRPTKGGELQRKESGCSRKVVRNQIKRVVDNLEQVLTALRDVHQEMKEVVQQIDNLTSAIDLNAEEPERGDSDSSSGSTLSEATVGRVHRRPSVPEEQPGTSDSSGSLGRGPHGRSQSPPHVPLCPVTSGFSTVRGRTLRLTSTLGSSPRRGGTLRRDATLSPQRSLPVRPPTPGLSPLTVNLHHHNSPGSQPHSPGASSSSRVSPVSPLSPKPHPPPAFSPSVAAENKICTFQAPQSGPPSAGLLSPSSAPRPSVSCPPTGSTQAVSDTERERRVSSAGPAHAISQVRSAPVDRRGRKPPPYPHRGSSEHTKKAKEPRKAPPYPEKRRLLSTTV